MLFDYIIVGAGPAGCFCATELVRRGRSVCVLEKADPGFRKVCGDGVSMTCIEVLKRMEFPVKRFAAAGAVPIHKYFYYREGVLREKDVDLEAYCLPRNRTDELFRQYAHEDFGVEIVYREAVREIRSASEGYHVNGRSARRIILAVGAGASVALDGRPLLPAAHDRPVGVSLIAKGAAKRDDFFLFDYKPEYDGTYAWIFSLGGGFYNVGLWRRTNTSLLRREAEEFFAARGREWLGQSARISSPPRGMVMGIGPRLTLPVRDIFPVGDAANMANADDGEGISRAILDAKRLIKMLEGEEEMAL